MFQPDRPFVSVIIPVFNDADRLKICLAALGQQTYPKNRYEIVVIDNGSDPEQAIGSIVNAYDQAIGAYEPVPGSYAARNRGIALAQGNILAFTDADCVPAGDWIERGVQHLTQTPNCGLVAGKIDVFFQNPDRLTIVELYESVMAFQQREHLEKYRYGSTANVLTFRQVIDRVGQFDAALKSNGDFEWGRRVAAAGYQQVYAEDVCVAHPARHSFAQLYQRSVRLAGGIYDAQIQKCSSWLDRNKLFIRSVAEDFTSPLLALPDVLFERRLNSIQEKLKFYFVMFCVRYIWGIEKIRLKFGGVSTRG